MALPINIEDLLKKRKVESVRIEFKRGWNPDKIYRTICAFANDFDNLGGGYILVGVEEENGVAKRPVAGVPMEELDRIQRDMLAYDAKIEPRYLTRVSVEEVDGRTILVIWVPSGLSRPYSVMENVTARRSVPKYDVRSKASTIEAKGETLDELREMANRIPFDERPNEALTVADLSPVLVYDYLRKTGSKLTASFDTARLGETLEAMDLYTGPSERRVLKNVAAMMFCEHPEKFFPVTQVDIVVFPEGCERNPDLMIEAPKITGPVPQMISAALEYLRTVIVQDRIIKLPYQAEALHISNYPFAALEEAVVNALYHRSYREREPVEITVEPQGIGILSFGGPDRTISDEALKSARRLKARRYRNRRLGDFLKELGLTEGRGTGLPTLQAKMEANGSRAATIETDACRTYFLLTLPCREGFEDALDVLNPNKILSLDGTEANNENRQLLQTIKVAYEKVHHPDFQVDIAFFNQLFRIIKELSVKVWSKSRKGPSPERLIHSTVDIIVYLCFQDQGATTLNKEFGWGNLQELRRKILAPLIDLGVLDPTRPDAIRSSKQTYTLTPLWKQYFHQKLSNPDTPHPQS